MFSGIRSPKSNSNKSHIIGDDGPQYFSFPYPPYDVQMSLMTDMYVTIDTRCVGIFESPTGTGKTLSTLCAVLSFIEDEQKSKKKHIEENRVKEKKLRQISDYDTYEDSLNKFGQSEKYRIAADTLEKKLQRAADRIEDAKRRVKTYKEVKNKKTKVKDIEDVGLIKDDDEPPELLKVIYATRTHSQIDQLTKELGRTHFRPRVVCLGSRAKLCPNSEVNSLPNALAAEKCKDLRETNKCSYYSRAKTRLIADHILSGTARNANDVIKESHCSQACGYYGSREAVPFCEVIFVPYATLFDSEMRKSVGLNIDKDTIIIVDEAHNLYATLTEMSSAITNLTELQTGLTILSDFLKFQSDRLTPTETKNLKLFLSCLQTTVNHLDGSFFTKTDKRNFQIYEFLEKVFAGEGLRYIQAIEAAKKSVLLSRIRSFMRSKKAAQLKEQAANREGQLSGVQKLLQSRKRAYEVTVTPEPVVVETNEEFIKFPLFKLAEFFSALGAARENYEVVVTLETPGGENPSKTDRTIHLLCLNGGEKFGPIVTNARSTVLVGGTMAPTALLLDLLKVDCGISEDMIVGKSYGHIINQNQLKIVTIKRDELGSLILNHTNTITKQIHHRILAAMTPFLSETPNGLSVFFPSLTFLNNFLTEVNQSKPPGYDELTRRGFITEAMYADAFARYVVKANSQKATFFAVIGGKFSEGVNFSDKIARCVIIVGLPYPNVYSDEFKAKSEYLKRHFNDPTISTNLPLNICMTAVNQTIGRVVRHRKDYGVVVLIDNRYGEPRHVLAFSSWMMPCLSQTETKLEAMNVVKGFHGMYSG